MLRRAVCIRLCVLFLSLVVAACAASDGDGRIGSSHEELLGNASDEGFPEANITVAIEKADGSAPACSGVLLTPTVVLTARPCVDPAMVGAWPTVRVGQSFNLATRYFSTRKEIQPGAAPGSPPSVDFNGQLALIYLDPRKPVLDVAAIVHPSLGNVFPAGDRNPDKSWSYANVGMSGWSVTGAPPSSGRQSVVFGGSIPLFFNNDLGGVNPFWLRSTAGIVKLTDVDLGGPLFVQSPTTKERQVFGIAIAMGVAANPASSGGCPLSATSCDIWADLTADPNLSWIRSKLEIPYLSEGPGKNSHWFETHPKEDGTPWWLGEVDYLGACQQARDADCDHWYDTTINPSISGIPASTNNRDNCLGWWNPSQDDADDDGYGNFCDNCPMLVNPKQEDSMFHNPVTGPAGRAAESQEILSNLFPGDACSSDWTGYDIAWKKVLTVGGSKQGGTEQSYAPMLATSVAPDADMVFGFSGLGDTRVLQWNGSTAINSQVQMKHINSAWARASNDVWAAGYQIIYHFDGSIWRWYPLDPLINLVGGSAQNDVWAVGQTSAGDNTALHFNGTAWTTVQSWTQVENTTETLTGIWASGPSDAWIVGYDIHWGSSEQSDAPIFHWDGTAWSHVPSGAVGQLNAVWGSGPSDVWAAGADGLMLHWDGAGWKTVYGCVDDPNNGGTHNYYMGLSGTGPNDVWAITDATTPKVVHYDGVTWSRVGVAASDEHFASVAASAASGVWVASSINGQGYGAIQQLQ